MVSSPVEPLRIGHPDLQDSTWMTATERHSRQDEAALTRRRVLDAAIELAGDGGIESMSIQAVASRSGVTRGAIAFHFGTKDDLVAAVVEATFEWSRHYVDERLRAAETRSIRTLVDTLFELMEEPEARVFNPLIASAIRDDSPIRETYASHYDGLRATFSAYIAAAAPELERPDALAAVLLGATLGINLQQRLAGGRLDRRAAFDEISALFDAASGRTDD